MVIKANGVIGGIVLGNGEFNECFDQRLDEAVNKLVWQPSDVVFINMGILIMGSCLYYVSVVMKDKDLISEIQLKLIWYISGSCSVDEELSADKYIIYYTFVINFMLVFAVFLSYCLVLLLFSFVCLI